MMSEYFPVRGRPLNRVKKPSSFNNNITNLEEHLFLQKIIEFNHFLSNYNYLYAYMRYASLDLVTGTNINI